MTDCVFVRLLIFAYFIFIFILLSGNSIAIPIHPLNYARMAYAQAKTSHRLHTTHTHTGISRATQTSNFLYYAICVFLG